MRIKEQETRLILHERDNDDESIISTVDPYQPKVLCRILRDIKTEISRSVILPVVMYGCETWSLTLMKGYRLRVFENRVLREEFGPKREEITGGWKRLHNTELNDLYCS